MAEQILFEGKECFKYADGTIVPKEKHEKATAAIKKYRQASDEEKAIRKRKAKATVRDVIRHLHWYLMQDGFMESYANKKALRSVGLPEDENIQWQAVMWAVGCRKMLESSSMEAINMLLKIDEHQSNKRHRLWEEQFKLRVQRWQENGKGRQVDGEVIESDYGETKV
jgi:hypothetical protein